MRNKLFFSIIIVILLVITSFGYRYYDKIGEHDIQLNEYLLQDYDFQEISENNNLYEIYSFSAESLQLQKQLFRVLIQMKTSFNYEYQWYSNDNNILLYLDYFMQEKLLEQNIRDQVIYFENIKFIGVTEVTVLSGFPEKRPVFTFTKDTTFKLIYRKHW